MARTRLFGVLQRAVRMARWSRRPAAPPLDEIIAMHRERPRPIGRRSFLAGTVGAAAAAAIGAEGCKGNPSVRVAIVGGGLAGMTAAWVLQKAGIEAEIYEAAERLGGRAMTSKNLLAPGLFTELGGEFIDTQHEDLVNLARELELPLFDAEGTSEKGIIPNAYYFGGMHRTEAEVITAFAPLAAKMEDDLANVGDVSYQADGGGKALDEMSITAYFDKIGASGWIRDLLLVAYVTEYGLEADEQSALNLLFLIGTDTSNGFEIFGSSDERYTIQGGVQQVVDVLGKKMEAQVNLGHKLVRIAGKGDGFTLDFEVLDEPSLSVDADLVLLTLPFTTLRDVDLQVELPAAKKKAIAELGYGMNAKILVGTTARVWRDQGYSGYSYTDGLFQLAWDCSRGQPGTNGGITFFSGGQPGLDVGQDSPASQAEKLLASLEPLYPGVTASYNGTAARFHWPTYNLSKGSYACYLTGQWTSISGAEYEPVGNLFFAGEHTSLDFQGFLGGAVQTGKSAAEEMLKLLKAG
jgi:monoamine oxidase